MSAVRVRLPPLKPKTSQHYILEKKRVNAGSVTSQNLENCIEESEGIKNETKTGRKTRKDFGVQEFGNEQRFKFKREKLVKIERADGGNLGTQRRRRTWRPTKGSGKREASNEPEVSEWGNPETQC